MSLKEEMTIGGKVHEEMVDIFGIYDDPELISYIEEIGQRLISNMDPPPFDISITIFDYGLNGTSLAGTLPGGHVFVDRNLLVYLNNEAELAALLAHEIGHAISRHYARMVQIFGSENICDSLPSANFSRQQVEKTRFEHEFEADEIAIQLLLQAGYDPLALAEVITWLSSSPSDIESFDSDSISERRKHCPRTHPPTKQRVSRIYATAAESETKNLHLGRDDYLTKIDGIHAFPNYKEIIHRIDIDDKEGLRHLFPDSYLLIEVVDVEEGEALDSLISDPRFSAFSFKEVIGLINRLDENEKLSVGGKIKMIRGPKN